MLIEQVDVTNFEDFDGHEAVYHCSDERSGLQAYIGIHNRNLGPALGGCRIWPYATSDAAITDVLRLSRGMTYKSAISGLPLGGGKAVIIGSPGAIKTPLLLRTMGQFIESLRGAYITAEDSGTGVKDLETMAIETRHVSGISRKNRHAVSNGDPSPVTAYGVFVGICAAAEHRFGSRDLAGLKVAVQGVGNVGRHLVELLVQADARVSIADINPHQTDAVLQRLPVQVLSNDLIHRQAVDVYAPCALGGVLNQKTISEIRAPVIAGAANNQLQNPEAGEMLFRNGTLYAPDYVVNAGGIIDIYYERAGYDFDKVATHINGIADTLRTIFQGSESRQIPTNVMADCLAESRFTRQPLVNVA